jgi:hypothetical protein
MNEVKAVGGTGGKKRGQDVLGCVLVIVGGYFALSILLGLVGREPKSGILTDPVVGLVGLLGAWPSLLLTLGWALLGMVLFLGLKDVQPIRPFFAVTGLGLGASLLLGAFTTGGGEVGSVLPGAFTGTTGRLLGLALGSISVWIGGTLLLVGRARMAPAKPRTAEPVFGGGREPAPDGVSPDEAAALVGPIRVHAGGPAAPHADPTPAARDVRARPLGPAPSALTDAATRPAPRPIAREADAHVRPARALARPAAEPARADLAPAPGDSQPAESPASLLARIAVENRERARGLKADPSVRPLDPPGAASGSPGSAATDELPFAPSWEGLAGDHEPAMDADIEVELQSESGASGTAESEAGIVLPFQTTQPWAEELEDDGSDEPSSALAELEAEPTGEDALEEGIDSALEEVGRATEAALFARPAQDPTPIEARDSGAASDPQLPLGDEDLEAQDAARLEDVEIQPARVDADVGDAEHSASARASAELVPAKPRLDQKSLFDERPDAAAVHRAPASKASSRPEPALASEEVKRTTRGKRVAASSGEPEHDLRTDDAAVRSVAADETPSAEVASAAAPAERAYVLTPAANDPDSAFRKLVFDAGCLVLEENRVAVSMLQRRFSLDFDQACAVLDRLQAEGLIGAYMGGRTRDILLTREEWLSKLGSHSPAG